MSGWIWAALITTILLVVVEAITTILDIDWRELLSNPTVRRSRLPRTPRVTKEHIQAAEAAYPAHAEYARLGNGRSASLVLSEALRLARIDTENNQ